MARNDVRRGTPARKPVRPVRTGWRLWLRRTLIWGSVLALLGAFGLGVAVVMAAQSLPSYSQLKSSQNGQMIVVCARAMGPNWSRSGPATANGYLTRKFRK